MNYNMKKEYKKAWNSLNEQGREWWRQEALKTSTRWSSVILKLKEYKLI